MCTCACTRACVCVGVCYIGICCQTDLRMKLNLEMRGSCRKCWQWRTQPRALIQLIGCISFYCSETMACAFFPHCAEIHFILLYVFTQNPPHCCVFTQCFSTCSTAATEWWSVKPDDVLCFHLQAWLRWLTVLKLWKRPMLAGWGDSRENWRKGFMSSGVGMTDGLLRKAGTGPDRLILPVGETPRGKLVIKAFFFIILFFVPV